MNVEVTTNLLADMVDHLPLGVILLEPLYAENAPQDFRWLFVNQLAAELSAIQPHLTIGKRLLETAPHLKETKLFEHLLEVAMGREVQYFEHFVSAEQAASKQDTWYGIKVQPYSHHVLVTFEDITKRKEIEGYVRQMAFQDELTGVYNRRFFRSRVPSLISLARREHWGCALIYLDLNGFKVVNDSYGHGEGDQVLRALAWRLDAVSREGEIFFRAGGDEFALFLPKADITAALGAAKRITAELSLPLTVNEHAHRIGASIGVAVMPAKDANIDMLVERADKAMYAAKARKGEFCAISLWTPDDSEEDTE
jgi:diguanylate cyclase (GGDEF)-like protein